MSGKVSQPDSKPRNKAVTSWSLCRSPHGNFAQLNTSPAHTLLYKEMIMLWQSSWYLHLLYAYALSPDYPKIKHPHAAPRFGLGIR